MALIERCFILTLVLQNEPAQYEFSYEVDAQDYGTQFGHQEQRDGDQTQGSYHVLLPDGRLQTVEYEADQDGYRPTVSYQGGDNGGTHARPSL